MMALRQFPKLMLGEGLPKTPCYFLIQYGHVQRWSGKHSDVRDAANECFGLSTARMLAWNLGTNLALARKEVRKLRAPEEYLHIIEALRI